ncbi:hypothetical protein L218DRAFT_968131 [Marasmius fiardii PR-910]|nr:hypothetical protein L218DRAFT_968131 [Marasmius fiardii PR-910]
MRSFAFFATLAATALSFTFAAPVVEGVGNGVYLPDQGYNANIVPENTIPSVLQITTLNVAREIQPLTYITKDNCTIGHISPVVETVKSILSDAYEKCGGISHGIPPADGGVLSGALGDIFSLLRKVLSLGEIAKLVVGLLQVVLSALFCVVKVAGSNKGLILPLLQSIVEILCKLIGLVLGLVGALLPLVLSLLKVVLVDVAEIIKALEVGDKCGAIGISY